MTGPRSHLHLLYGGIDTRHFSPAADDGALRRSLGWSTQHLVFAVVGYMNPPQGKGQLEFLEAAARLREMLPQARFLMVGNGELRDTVRRRAEALGLGDRVALLPHQDDILTVYRAIDVLVHPAVGSEALGMVLWEALACGKPVIASRLDGIPEAFEENRHGLLVPPREVAPLAQAMLKLGSDAGLRAQFGAAGRAHVEAHFDRRHYAERAHALYSKIAA
jgi:glycosyltransferase involved in cell wall biosynthesis